MAGEARKTVTIVFVDVTGSTSLGERLDPEALRDVMARYFTTAQHVFERHGGLVEKFIGDAVMAVFGLPTVHEDDALRAVRAAAELRDELATLNDELERERGVRIALRTGVNTGEVVIGDQSGQQFYATGDAVNVAARLEQRASPGFVRTGGDLLRLIYVMRADGRHVRRLTRKPVDAGMPAWSPDGRSIAFVSLRSRSNDIYVMNSDGTRVRRLTNNVRDDFGPRFSSTGKRLIFTRLGLPDGKTVDEIFTIDTDGKHERRVTSGFDPDWRA